MSATVEMLFILGIFDVNGRQNKTRKQTTATVQRNDEEVEPVKSNKFSLPSSLHCIERSWRVSTFPYIHMKCFTSLVYVQIKGTDSFIFTHTHILDPVNWMV